MIFISFHLFADNIAIYKAMMYVNKINFGNLTRNLNFNSVELQG